MKCNKILRNSLARRDASGRRKMTECNFYAEGLKLDAEERAIKAKVKKSKSATVRKAIRRAMKAKAEKN